MNEPVVDMPPEPQFNPQFNDDPPSIAPPFSVGPDSVGPPSVVAPVSSHIFRPPDKTVILFEIFGSYLFPHIWENILLKLGK